MHYQRSKTELEVYLETSRRRQFVGRLSHDEANARYVFEYDIAYLRSKSAFAIGAELPVTRLRFESEGEMFPTFLDRIPDKENPAYPDYCRSQGISPDEENLIVLLGTIGHRGPSSFIYEPVFDAVGTVVEELKAFRKDLALTQWDFANLFDFPVLTIQRIEAMKSKDKNILRLIHIFLTDGKQAIAQMQLSAKRVHRDVRDRVYRYFK